jgi:hypothetical protein
VNGQEWSQGWRGGSSTPYPLAGAFYAMQNSINLYIYVPISRVQFQHPGVELFHPFHPSDGVVRTRRLPSLRVAPSTPSATKSTAARRTDDHHRALAARPRRTGTPCRTHGGAAGHRARTTSSPTRTVDRRSASAARVASSVLSIPPSTAVGTSLGVSVASLGVSVAVLSKSAVLASIPPMAMAMRMPSTTPVATPPFDTSTSHGSIRLAQNSVIMYPGQ